MKLTTALVHLDRLAGEPGNGSLFEAKYETVAFEYDTFGELADVYQGKSQGYNYARGGSPTVAALERRMTYLEDGAGSVVFATGMAAYDALLCCVLKSNDHVIAASFLFANTVSLLDHYAERFGIDVEYVDVTNAGAVAAKIKPSTKLILVETIANPMTQIPDLERLGVLANEHGILYVIDNTVTTPIAFRPKDWGAHIIVNSLTKTLAGHGRALGGCITDTGTFAWGAVPGRYLEKRYQHLGKSAWLTQLRKKGLRNKGATLSSADAGMISMGMETAELRLERASRSALSVARYLESHDGVARVHFPGLPSHPQHARSNRLFRFPGSLMAFELKPRCCVQQFFNALKIVVRGSSLGDTRTLAIHPASTIFHEVGPDVRRQMGISDQLIRLSVGIEDAEDLCADLGQALSCGYKDESGEGGASGPATNR